MERLPPHTAEAMERMGVPVRFFIIYTGDVESVDAYLAGGVDDTVVAQVHSHMDYSTFFVGEETEVIFVC